MHPPRKLFDAGNARATANNGWQRMGDIVLGASWALGGIFAVAGLLAMVAPGTVADFYRHLQISPWARIALGLAKIATAILLFMPGLRFVAAAAGAAACAVSATLFALDQRFRLAGLTVATSLALVTTTAFERRDAKPPVPAVTPQAADVRPL